MQQFLFLFILFYLFFLFYLFLFSALFVLRATIAKEKGRAEQGPRIRKGRVPGILVAKPRDTIACYQLADAAENF